MEKNKVLLVGHCGFDSGRIVAALKKAGFEHYVSADTIAEAFDKLCDDTFLLVIANRVIAADEEGGINLVKKIKSEEKTRNIPVMVLSAFREVQKTAVDNGAVPGFGKDVLESEEAVEEFRKYLKSF